MQKRKWVLVLLVFLLTALNGVQGSAKGSWMDSISGKGITIRSVEIEKETMQGTTSEKDRETEETAKKEESEKTGSFAWFKKRIFPVISILLVIGICVVGILTVYDQKNAEKRRKEKEKDRGKKIILKDKKSNHSYTAVLYTKLTIGRNMEQCDLWISGDYTISGRHCRMLRKEGKIYVEDAGSSNGTLVNNQKITGAVEVHSGDTLKIGMTTFLIGFAE